MRFKRRAQLKHGLQQIDTIPFINTFFLLFIFFVFAYSFVMPSGIKVTLPKAVTSDIAASDMLQLSITSDNLLYLNSMPITVDELKSTLSRIVQKDPVFLIKADKGVALGRIVEIWNICRDLGISRVNVATTQ